jgi:hypothetical protein
MPAMSASRTLKQPDILPSRETRVTPPAAPALGILTTERIAGLAGESALQALTGNSGFKATGRKRIPFSSPVLDTWASGKYSFPTRYKIYSMGALVAVLLAFCSTSNSSVASRCRFLKGGNRHLFCFFCPFLPEGHSSLKAAYSAWNPEIQSETDSPARTPWLSFC